MNIDDFDWRKGLSAQRAYYFQFEAKSPMCLLFS